MRNPGRTIRLLATWTLTTALLLGYGPRPSQAFHEERKVIRKMVEDYREIRHHMEEGKVEWEHMGKELQKLARPIRSLGHHDKVDLFKPLQDAIRGKDKEGFEKAFQRVFVYLVRENLHRSEDSAGKVENTILGFVKNARLAYQPLAPLNGKIRGQVEKIFKEMETTAKEARGLKARLEMKKKELEKIVNEIQN